MKTSKIACPRLMSGPAYLPRRILSEMTAVRSGPGIIAPDRAMVKETKKIEISCIPQFYCGSNKK